MSVPAPSGDNAKQQKNAPVLQLGNSGEWVRTLQEMLGFTGTEVDGIFGPQTESKLVEYQKAHGIKPTGKVDGGTWKVLGTNGPLNGQTIDNTDQQISANQAGGSKLSIDQFLSGLRKTEHGVYDWQNNGSGAYGAYQILDSNWPTWAKDAGVDPNDHSKQAQDAVAHWRVEEYYKQFGGDWSKVAAAWYYPARAGDPRGWNFVPSGNNISIQDYVSRVMSNAGAPGAENGPASGASGPTIYQGAGAGNGQLTQEDLNTSLDSFGFPKALIDSDPSLQKAFNKILSQQLDITTSAGQARAEQILHGTQWWKSRTDAQRSFDAKMKDPATRQEALREIDQQKNDLRSLSLNLGYPINGPVLDKLARMTLRNKLDTNEINNALASHFQYHPNHDQYTGVAGSDISGLNKLAGDYYVNLGRGQIQDMVQRMIKGQLSPDAMTQYFQQQAEGAFPQLKQQIKSGYTVKDVLAPYLSDYANILELDSSAIKPEDPSLMKALQQPDGQGGFQLMPRWQFQQMLRNDPRWLNTQNAKATYLSTGIQVLKDWGLAS